MEGESMKNPTEAGLPYYWAIRTVEKKKEHLLYVYAKAITVESGHLLLWRQKEGEQRELYRGFAPGTWLEFYSASCLNGDQIGEQHDIDVATGKDAREEMSI
jgi:hypothetical protein